MSLLGKKFEQDQYQARHLVDELHEGIRLDQFVQLLLPSFSRQAVKEKIKKGEIVIEGRTPPHRPSCRLHHQEVVIINTFRSSHEDEFWAGKKLDLPQPRIIYEDDHLLVISKPPFMSTHPTGRHLFYCATVFYESLYNQTIHSIHRLDRETSGILLLGKNPDIANQLSEKFENSQVKKCYFFIGVINETYQGEDYLEARERLGSAQEGLKRVYVESFAENSLLGKRAYTEFYILHREDKYLLGLAFPHTGRQHQIRVHAMLRGFPLLGDKLYLGDFELFQRFKDQLATTSDHQLMQIPRHALHAIGLKMDYKKQIFLDQLPDDLKLWIEQNLSIELPDLNEKIAECFNR